MPEKPQITRRKTGPSPYDTSVFKQNLQYPLNFIYWTNLGIFDRPEKVKTEKAWEIIQRSYTNLTPEDFEEMTVQEIASFFRKTGSVVHLSKCPKCKKFTDPGVSPHGCRA